MTAVPTHPLDPLTPTELLLAADLVKKSFAETDGDDSDFLAKLRFETVELYEPEKKMVRSWQPGDAVGERRARVACFLIGGGIGVYRMVVNLSSHEVSAKEFLPKARPMIQLDEFVAIEDAVKADKRVIEACAKRGITDMSLLCIDPWSSGSFGFDYEADRHLSYTHLWVRSKDLDNLYAHPVDGLNAVVDIKQMKVVHVDDIGGPPIPKIDSNYDRAFLDEDKLRSDLKPINVSQPEGVSFSMDGHTLKWHEWSLLVGFNGREGITLSTISYGGRPVCYRASLAEMVVPYGSPREPHYRKNVFDIGEYGLGKMANSLELGCDCLGSIQYLDAHIIDMTGAVMTIRNAICIHEEDDGILWKHWDFRTDRTEVRRSRRLVISSISTVGNYEYGSYWYFYLDGMIEFEMKATGIINTVGCEPGKPEKYGAEVTPGVVGITHQHLFSARLDMSVDGDQNTVVECNTFAEPVGEANPYGNAFYVQATPLATEGGRPSNHDTERFWKFTNPNKTNHVGMPTAYKLEPADTKRVFTDPNSPSGKRMGWCYNALWVTPYHPEERYPTGEYVNQSDGESDGLTKYVQQGRSIDNTDLVAWHTFGLHHTVRPEDFPVQNCVSVGFKLMPAGFFDRNPNLDMPIEKNKASCYAACHGSRDAAVSTEEVTASEEKKE